MSDQWYLYQDNEKKGPFTWEELYAKARMHTIKGDDFVWHKGMADWARVETVPGLLSAAAAPPQVPPPAPPVTGWDGGRVGQQQQREFIPQQVGYASPLPPRGRYNKDAGRRYAYKPAEAEAEKTGSSAMGFKFRLTPAFRINWIALALLGIIVVAILIARILGL